MINTNIIIGIVAALVVVGGGAYVYTQMDGSAEVRESEQLSLRTLFDRDDQKCTFKTTVDGMVSEGTLYISDGCIRGDFTSQVQGKTELSHMIATKDEMRIWQHEQTTGFTMQTS